MPCGTVVGASLTFGVDNDEGSLTTESISVVQTSDKKEARDKCGNVVAIAYYNKRTEISVKGLGASSAAIGSSLSLAGSYSPVGTVYIDEVSIDRSNEEFVTSEIKAVAYEGIA